jgi:hypothetical protein
MPLYQSKNNTYAMFFFFECGLKILHFKSSNIYIEKNAMLDQNMNEELMWQTVENGVLHIHC